MTNDLKELTKSKKGLMRGLHLVYGFNFEKPYTVAKVETPTTIGAMRKAVAAEPTDTVVVLIPNRYTDTSDLCAVELDPIYSQGFDVDGAKNLRRYEIRIADAFDYFWVKKDFTDKRSDSFRKRSIIVVAQSRKCQFSNTNREEYLTRKQNAYRGADKPMGIRHKIVEITDHSYGTVYDYRPLNANRNYRVDHFTTYPDEKETATDFIDKSGYLVKSYRDALKQKAEDRRAELKRAEVQKMDYSDRVKTLREVIQTRQNALADALRFASTSKALRKIGEDISYWHGLVDMMEDFEEFADNVENKSFASVEACDALYNRILNNAINGRQ